MHRIGETKREGEPSGCKRSWKFILSLSKEPALSLSKGFVTGLQGCGRYKRLRFA